MIDKKELKKIKYKLARLRRMDIQKDVYGYIEKLTETLCDLVDLLFEME